MKPRKIFYILVVVVITILPYMAGFLSSGEDRVFVGFLVNPYDGNSYLAKMQLGLRGGWKFHLPYTADSGNGAYLFLFYIFLGHLSRWLGLAPITMFHLARVLSGVTLFVVLHVFYDTVYGRGNSEAANKAFYLAVVGSGLGWVASFAGMLSPDLWIPEAYPFFSAYATPHFPLGMALLLVTFTISLQELNWLRIVTLVISGGLLGVIMPFGVVLTGIVLTVQAVCEAIQSHKIVWLPVFSSLSIGGPLVLYQYWATLSDPILAGWNVQNVTPAPKILELVLGFLPVLFVALWGMVNYRQLWQNPAIRLLNVWVLTSLVLVYSPFSLQRRFMFALFVPVAGLAVQGLMSAQLKKKQKMYVWYALLFLSIPTNVILVLSGLYGIQKQDPRLYLTGHEKAVLEWVDENTPDDALILSSPEIGLFIPAQTGRKVLYGHPFETVNAEEEKFFVESFFAGNLGEEDGMRSIKGRGVDFIFYGPREAKLGYPDGLEKMKVVFRQGEVVLFAVGDQ